MSTEQSIIFVYNAESGLFSLVTDFAHKLLSPESYSCQLCKLTYGTFQMKNEWKDFLKSLPFKKTFLHKDEFIKTYPSLKDNALPAVYIQKTQVPTLLLSAEDINAQSNLLGLQKLLHSKLL